MDFIVFQQSLTMTKIYLAGPDVFRENAKEYFEWLKAIALKYDVIALSPLDNDGNSNTAEDIFNANIKIINRVQAVVANLIPFRGSGVDDGTAFEIGYAYAKGLKIYGYSAFSSETYPNIIELLKTEVGPEFPVIESFGHSCNLMIAESILKSGGNIFETFENCMIEFAYDKKNKH
jgi:nucleoside 2-deoxyribosyltransferase